MTGTLLGIDVGTFETKGVLVNENGKVLARARRSHGIEAPQPNHVEQNPELVWWRDVSAIARELTQNPAATDMRGVAVSAIGPCIVATDAALEPMRPAILYGVDNRAEKQIAYLTKRFGETGLLARCGNNLTSQSGGPKIAWLRDEEPETWSKARWFMTSQSWLVAKLTGEVVIDHATAGYFHPLYDYRAHNWDLSGCEDFIDVARLPRLAWSSETAGGVTAAASAITGIPAGTPVMVGTTDSPAEAVGAGVIGDGDLMIQYGSTAYLIRLGTENIVNPLLWSAPFVFEGLSVLAAGTSTAGTATRWVSEILGIAEIDDDATFRALLETAGRSAPGAHGVLMLPHLSGERTPFQDPKSRAAFIGLGLEHTQADIARAVLEGIGHSIAAAIALYADSGAPVNRLVAVGGGTRNPIILGSVSTITGLTQVVANSDGAAYGDAIIAAVGVGILASPTDSAAWFGASRVVKPDPRQRARLAADQADYLALYRALAPIAHARAAL